VTLAEVGRVNLREAPGPHAPTVCANLLRPLLLDVARTMDRAPERLIVSGLLREEADEVARAFAVRGLEEEERRHCEDWSALLLVGSG
jgi:ribosomal protein L11 methylase PrmA